MSPIAPIMACLLLSALAFLEFSTRSAQLQVSCVVLFASVAGAVATHALMRKAPRPSRAIAVALFVFPIAISTMGLLGAL